MTQPEDLRYPVICFARDDAISVVNSPGELHSCNAVAWFRNRYFEDLRVIDAVATPFRVQSATLARPLYDWRRILARTTNKNLLIVRDLESLGEASLAEAKQTAIEWLQRAPEFGESAFALPEWERLISQASSTEILCDVFS